MNKLEAKKNIIKHNKLRREIERLRKKLWNASISSEDFKVYQTKLKKAEHELKDNIPEHRKALKFILG